MTGVKTASPLRSVRAWRASQCLTSLMERLVDESCAVTRKTQWPAVNITTWKSLTETKNQRALRTWRSHSSTLPVFHSFHGLMNSINWPASSVWVFMAQLGEHCSANAEATGSNPVEAPKIFFSGYFRNCLNCDSLRWSHTHFMSYICTRH